MKEKSNHVLEYKINVEQLTGFFSMSLLSGTDV